MGSDHPIVRQTMTTSDTRDVEATVAEVRPPSPASNTHEISRALGRIRRGRYPSGAAAYLARGTRAGLGFDADDAGHRGKHRWDATERVPWLITRCPRGPIAPAPSPPSDHLFYPSHPVFTHRVANKLPNDSPRHPTLPHTHRSRSAPMPAPRWSASPCRV